LAVEISDLFFSIYANLYRKSDLFENLKTKRDRQKLWGLLLRDLKTTSKNKKKLTVNIDISNDAPDFMSAKWKVRDNPSNVNFYEQLKEEVGEH
jgi:outer membrane lipoprotein-sorting protein